LTAEGRATNRVLWVWLATEVKNILVPIDSAQGKIKAGTEEK